MLKKQAELAQERPLAWLEMQSIYGNLIEDKRFTDAFERWLSRIYQDGMEATLRHYLGEISLAS